MNYHNEAPIVIVFAIQMDPVEEWCPSGGTQPIFHWRSTKRAQDLPAPFLKYTNQYRSLSGHSVALCLSKTWLHHNSGGFPAIIGKLVVGRFLFHDSG